ncbi:hypothetical protein QAD02_022218 [Eretmocerus hayati]|uniref:Uncharacterized protein n=1 Tax=Eretmocerus hayati TaxID=131215 RepID=A0ACC2PS52_9HYME|nr:hypothetical protein QAD02_022218 [Eretmocerus hayati]
MTDVHCIEGIRRAAATVGRSPVQYADLMPGPPSCNECGESNPANRRYSSPIPYPYIIRDDPSHVMWDRLRLHRFSISQCGRPAVRGENEGDPRRMNVYDKGDHITIGRCNNGCIEAHRILELIFSLTRTIMTEIVTRSHRTLYNLATEGVKLYEKVVISGSGKRFVVSGLSRSRC